MSLVHWHQSANYWAEQQLRLCFQRLLSLLGQHSDTLLSEGCKSVLRSIWLFYSCTGIDFQVNCSGEKCCIAFSSRRHAWSPHKASIAHTALFAPSLQKVLIFKHIPFAVKGSSPANPSQSQHSHSQWPSPLWPLRLHCRHKVRDRPSGCSDRIRAEPKVSALLPTTQTTAGGSLKNTWLLKASNSSGWLIASHWLIFREINLGNWNKEHNLIYLKNFRSSLHAQWAFPPHFPWKPQSYCDLTLVISPEKGSSKSECY